MKLLKQLQELRKKERIDVPPKIRPKPTGSKKAIVLLVEFDDNRAETAPSYYKELLFSKGTYPTGSLRDYYNENSYQQLDIDGDISIKWYRAPQNYRYYHDNQGGMEMGNYPQNAQRLVEDVISIADNDIDFSQYDLDNNGIVDYLIVVHAGVGAEEVCKEAKNCPHIWSHMWELPQEKSTNDNVKIKYYIMCAEKSRIGTFAHEFGHLLGLPEMYDTDSSSMGLGEFSLMAAGSWLGPQFGDATTPSHLDLWSKIYLGFVQPENITQNQSIDIPAIETNPTCFRLWTKGEITKEYFVIENRQRIGFDKYLPAEGLLIYHIDEKRLDAGCIDNNDCNDNEWYPGHEIFGHYLAAIEQADGRFDLEKKVNKGDSSDTYPGSSNNRTFDYFTTPSSKSYDGGDTEVSITNISDSKLIMTADVKIKRIGELNITWLDLSEEYISVHHSYQNIPLLQLTFTANYQPVEIQQIRIDKLGNIKDSDITAIKIYNADNVKIAELINPISPFIFIFSPPLQIDTTNPSTISIKIDINQNLSNNTSIKLEIKDTSYIKVDENSIVMNNNFPIQTKEVNILIGGLLNVTTENLLPNSIDLSTQSENIPVLKLLFTANYDNIIIQDIIVEKLGNIPIQDITLKLFEDNLDGIFSLNDNLLAIGTALSLTISRFTLIKQLNSNNTLTLFIVADLNKNLDTDYSFGLKLGKVIVSSEDTVKTSSATPQLTQVESKEFKIIRVYPLSTKDYIIFKYEIEPAYDRVVLEIFNIRGDKIETKIDDNLNDDYIKLLTTHYSNNVYIYRLIVYNNNEKKVKVGKFFVVR